MVVRYADGFVRADGVHQPPVGMGYPTSWLDAVGYDHSRLHSSIIPWEGVKAPTPAQLHPSSELTPLAEQAVAQASLQLRLDEPGEEKAPDHEATSHPETSSTATTLASTSFAMPPPTQPNGFLASLMAGAPLMLLLAVSLVSLIAGSVLGARVERHRVDEHGRSSSGTSTPISMSCSWATLPTGSSTYLNSLIQSGAERLNSISKAGRLTGYVADGRGPVIAQSVAAPDGRGAGDEPQEQPYMSI